MKFTVRRKFLIPTLFIIFLGMVLSATISYQISKKAMKNILIDQITQVTVSTSRSLQEWIDEATLDTGNLSKMDMVQKAIQNNEEGEKNRLLLNELLINFRKNYDNFEDICLADTSGLVIAGANPESIQKINVSDREYFKKSMKGQTAVSDIIKSKFSGNPVAVVSFPVQKDNRTSGVFYSVIDISIFSKEYIDTIKVGDHGYGYMVNAQGIVVAHPDKNQIFKLNMSDLMSREDVQGKEKAVIEYTLKGVKKIVSFQRMVENGWIVAAGGLNDEIFKPVYNLRNVNMLISLAVLLVVGLITFFVANSVVKPINTVKEGLRDAAEGEGDLTKRLTVSTDDEVGELARWFNVFIEKIQNLISEISHNAGNLSRSSSSLERISSDLSGGAAEISSKTSAVSAAGEEMSISMDTVAKTMDQNANNVNMVAASIEEMESTIQEIAKSTDKARTTTHSAVSQSESVAKKISVLGSAARDIEKVVESITDISEQVNLLALNATIEAARAGEAGKGFAVVANEIKDLARQTSQATDEIKDRVNAIQESTGDTTVELESITRVINDVNDVVTTIAAAIEEQSSAAREMSGNISDTSSGINDVNANVAQSSQVSNEIAGQISDVNLAIQTMAENSQQVNTNATDLSKMAVTLNDLVGRFKI